MHLRSPYTSRLPTRRHRATRGGRRPLWELIRAPSTCRSRPRWSPRAPPRHGLHRRRAPPPRRQHRLRLPQAHHHRRRRSYRRRRPSTLRDAWDWTPHADFRWWVGPHPRTRRLGYGGASPRAKSAFSASVESSNTMGGPALWYNVFQKRIAGWSSSVALTERRSPFM